MKAILYETEIRVPYHEYYSVNENSLYWLEKTETHQNFTIYGEDIEFDVRMLSKNGFKIPDYECGVEVEMKFTFTPKTPKSETITLK